MPKGTVLVVNDEPDLAETIKLSLEKAGYEVLAARDGFEALGTVRADAPDLLILDATLPGKNGYEIIEVLRKDQRDGCVNETMKIIMLTAIKPELHQEAEMQAAWAGADVYLCKPFEVQALVSLVDMHIPRSSP